MHMCVAQDNTPLNSLHGYGTREETRVAIQDVKPLTFARKMA